MDTVGETTDTTDTPPTIIAQPYPADRHVRICPEAEERPVRDKAMVAVIRLQRDVCLMKTSLDILGQYALSLQGSASKMIERSFRASDFPSADVAAGALGFRVHRASVQMEAMGLWRPSLDPIRLN